MGAFAGSACVRQQALPGHVDSGMLTEERRLPGWQSKCQMPNAKCQMSNMASTGLKVASVLPTLTR
jgi:hypothetical protein